MGAFEERFNEQLRQVKHLALDWLLLKLPDASLPAAYRSSKASGPKKASNDRTEADSTAARNSLPTRPAQPELRASAEERTLRCAGWGEAEVKAALAASQGRVDFASTLLLEQMRQASIHAFSHSTSGG